MGAEILESMTYLLQAGALFYNIPLTYNGSLLVPGSIVLTIQKNVGKEVLGGGVDGRKTLANYSEIGNKMSKDMRTLAKHS